MIIGDVVQSENMIFGDINGMRYNSTQHEIHTTELLSYTVGTILRVVKIIPQNL